MVSSKCWPTALLPNLPEIQPLLNSHFIFLPSETKAVGVRPICLRHYKHKLWEYYCHFKLFNIAIEIMNKYPIFILKRNKCFIFYNTEIIFIKTNILWFDFISEYLWSINCSLIAKTNQQIKVRALFNFCRVNNVDFVNLIWPLSRSSSPRGCQASYFCKIFVF